LIHQLGYENATLVGHDWGGIIAWYCAMFEPRIVKNLVIMNAPHIPTMMNNLFLRNKNVERMEVLKQLLATFYIAIITLPWPFYNIWLTWRNYETIRTIVSDGGRRSREDVDMYVAAFSLPNVVHTTRCYYKYAMHAKMDAKRDITAPTLVLWGNYDWALREKVCLTGLEECVYDLDICILEQEGHMIPESRPRDVNDALEEFLQKHDTTTERRE
jgi:pimeloyl-ACP methyl ester carboxylesterase